MNNIYMEFNVHLFHIRILSMSASQDAQTLLDVLRTFWQIVASLDFNSGLAFQILVDSSRGMQIRLNVHETMKLV